MTSRLNQDCVENLFSIIRGKGGFRDNTNPEQFKDAFRYVVADKLFVQSSSSNCKIDKILLDIKNIAMTKYKKPLPNEVKTVPAMDIAMIIKPPLSLPVQKVAVYLVGYLLRKVESFTYESEATHPSRQVMLKSTHQMEIDLPR